ncbi:hypothetical protein Rsub_02209 [Raphidocelis subcapitata]|uniref:F-box/LRR-repeat protein 15-like leucin rich repeat domain-containing protein n=1 Tax=Raphidocelis subcapitata TaxID=307507 RepID=A0A2V0NRQ0_9CHLO|nr:hypothetical protein Rsub_02209 [Raphidocelis subcapitata]|eukprot:GBF89332.1 hypothetical protein Rsub_02209 [Raphidocelis subcapitata]
MGNALCLAQREKKPPDYATARISPIPAFRRRRRSSGDGASAGPPGGRSLQDWCVAAVAESAERLDISVLPSELIQRVADHLVDEGKLDLRLLPRALTPWTDSLPLTRCDGVDDAWLERAAVCSGLRVLDITNCNLVTSAGLLRLSGLRGLAVLRASNCHELGDDAMAAIGGFTRLRELRLDGCEAITDAGASALSGLPALRTLSLGKCARLGPGGLAAVGRLGQLTELDLGWCRGIGGGGGGGAGPGPPAAGRAGPAAAAAAVAAFGGPPPGALAAAAALAAALPAAVGAAAAAAAGGGDAAAPLPPPPAARAPGASPALHLETPGGACGPLAPLAGLTALVRLNLCAARVGDDALRPLAGLTALTSLDLSGNPRVTMRGLAAALLPPPLAAAAAAARPPPPAGCRRLARLRLRDCSVPDGGAGFDGLCSLAPTLRALDLSCTRVGGRGLLALARLTGLTELLLDMCPVTDEGCAVFSALTNLESLELSDTEIGDAGASQLARLPRLERLGLGDTSVGDGAVAALTGLSRLARLNLDARHVSDEALRLALPLAPTLRELDLYSCRVTLRGAAALPAYTALTHLFLCGGWLTDRSVVEIAKLPSLQHLSIAQNPRLTDAAPRALADGACAQTLEALNLTGTGVGDGCVAALAGMPVLSVVALGNTRVSRAGADSLRRAAPRVLVKHPPHCCCGGRAPGGGGGGGAAHAGA